MLRFHIGFIMALYCKTRQILIQNATAVLLQNETVLLQNETIITNCDNFITKCNVYYKLRQYNYLSHVILYIQALFRIDCQLPKTLTVTTYNNNGNNFQVN